MNPRDTFVLGLGTGSLLTALMLPAAVVLHRLTQRRLPVRTDWLMR